MPLEPKYPTDEYAEKGKATYRTAVRPHLRPEDDNKYVAVDIDTGEYEVDDSDYQAVMRLRARRPDAQIWLERAGHPTAYRMRGSSFRFAK